MGTVMSSQVVANISECCSFLNSYFGLAGGKHYQKITVPIFRLVIQKFPQLGYSFYICAIRAYTHTHQKLKFFVAMILYHQMIEFVPKLFEFFKYLNF